MNAQNILQKVSYPLGNPDNALDIIEKMLAAKNLGYKTFEKIEEETGCKYGYFECVKEVIKEERKGSTISKPISREERINNYLSQKWISK